ncbi:putative quinol monooxygenase [Brucellaceae bacterium C25G]
MLLIVGTVRLPADNLNAARAIMEAMILASRREDGCLGYSYAEDVLVPGLIHVKEFWRDQASLDQHFASAHIAKWRSAWPQLGIHDRDLTIFEVGEGRVT